MFLFVGSCASMIFIHFSIASGAKLMKIFSETFISVLVKENFSLQIQLSVFFTDFLTGLLTDFLEVLLKLNLMGLNEIWALFQPQA